MAKVDKESGALRAVLRSRELRRVQLSWAVSRSALAAARVVSSLACFQRMAAQPSGLITEYQANPFATRRPRSASPAAAQVTKIAMIATNPALSAKAGSIR